VQPSISGSGHIVLLEEEPCSSQFRTRDPLRRRRWTVKGTLYPLTRRFIEGCL